MKRRYDLSRFHGTNEGTFDSLNMSHYHQPFLRAPAEPVVHLDADYAEWRAHVWLDIATLWNWPHKTSCTAGGLCGTVGDLFDYYQLRGAYDASHWANVRLSCQIWTLRSEDDQIALFRCDSSGHRDSHGVYLGTPGQWRARRRDIALTLALECFREAADIEARVQKSLEHARP